MAEHAFVVQLEASGEVVPAAELPVSDPPDVEEPVTGVPDEEEPADG
ncbi:hypothetical protein KMT30_06695 [Streptomyces sp. IBSBF 2953]|nr:hypothetical protein [Streptomyces hayashii]